MSGLAVAEDPLAMPGLPAGRGGTIFVGGARGAPAGVASVAWIGASDMLSLLAIVFALPFVILAVGVPIALALQVVFWLLRLL